MKVVILAGGLGTRLSEETDIKPKPMVEIGGYPIIWHVMKIYSSYGFNDFVICLGYKGYLIKEYFLNYRYHLSDLTIDIEEGSIEIHKSSSDPWRVTLVDTGDATMTGGRLKRVAHLLDETFCFTYSDSVGNINVRELVDFHRAHRSLVTVTAVMLPGRFGQLTMDGQEVLSFVEKPRVDSGRINGGFFVIEPEALDLISGDETIWEHEPVSEVVRQRQLMAYKHDGFWHPMDTLRDKRLLQQLWDLPEGAPWKNW